VLYRVAKLSYNKEENWHLSFIDSENETEGLIIDQVSFNISNGATIWTPKEGGMRDDFMRDALVSVVSTKMLANIHILEEDIEIILGM
jgi:hypothetical protein